MNKKLITAVCIAASALLSAQTPLDIQGAANMGFADPAADDGMGGWTDQGAGNDLRSMIGTTEIRFRNLRFPIIDPKKNGGKSCIVLSAFRPVPHTSGTIEVPNTAKGSVLMLIHACAWCPDRGQTAGEITAEYADGSTEKQSVISWRDLRDWANPAPAENASVVWTGRNAYFKVGVYFSQFKFKGKPVRFRFKSSNGSTMWMILSAALAEKKIPVEVKKDSRTFVLKADKNWIPVEFNGRTSPGTPLDFSSAGKPAGKYGFVIAGKDGHLAFEKVPGKRVRFFGPNIVSSTNTGTHEESDLLVAELVRMGYNCVRLHHYETHIQDLNAKTSLEFDPEKLDRFFYLISKLKENGLYISIDFYASRWLRPGDNFPELKGYDFSGYQEMKQLILVSRTGMENWKAYVRKLLTMKNPYTGMALVRDPVLWSANLINENPATAIWDRVPHLVPLYEQKFYEYLKAKGIDTPENRKNRAALFREFLIELQGKCIDEQIAFLRKELGFQALITDLNMRYDFSLVQLRDKLDLVDNHQYWDHPRFPVKNWRLPYEYSQGSAIRTYGALPRFMMPSRLFGKPYMISEYNFVAPNIYRVEASPLIGGYASLQDWDVLNRFAWSHKSQSIKTLGSPNGFDCINDPMTRLTELITNVLFVRGDVSSAKEAYAAVFKEKHKKIGSLNTELPFEFQSLGFFARTGSLMDGRNVPGVKRLDPFEKDWQKQLPDSAQKAISGLIEKGSITSSTGEITLNPRDAELKIVTPKTEVFTFTKSASGKIASFRNGNVFQTVSVISRDGLPLAQSRSILIFHLTNQAASEQTFRDSTMTHLISFGGLPVLIQHSVITAELKLPAGFRIQALSLNGMPNGKIPAEFKNGKYIFTMDNAAKKGGVMVYHLTR